MIRKNTRIASTATAVVAVVASVVVIVVGVGVGAEAWRKTWNTAELETA
jgi:hypothetical protein